MNNDVFAHLNNIDIIKSNKAVVLLDSDFKICYANHNTFELFDDCSILGKQVNEINHPINAMARDLKTIALKITKSRKTAKFFIFSKSRASDTKLCLYLTLLPLKIVSLGWQGLVSLIEPVNFNQTLSISNLFNQFNSTSDASHDTIALTQREEEIAFLLILGKSYKEIAQIITQANDKEVSFSTIGSVIQRQLFRKFEVDNIISLSYKLNRHHSLKSIPYSLLNNKEGIFELIFE